MAEYNGVHVGNYNASRSWETVEQVKQYLNTFKCCPDLLPLLQEWIDKERGDKVPVGPPMPPTPHRDDRSKKCCSGEAKPIVADGGMLFNQTQYVCPECGAPVMQANFCEKMLKGNPGLDASGMIVCSRHPLVSQTDPCFYEVYLPPRRKTGGVRDGKHN